MKIFFQFNGGPRDGELLEGGTEDADVAAFDIDDAPSYYWETNYGKPGTFFFVRSPYSADLPTRSPRAPSEHKYSVVHRPVESDGVWVVAKYVGGTPPVFAPL